MGSGAAAFAFQNAFGCLRAITGGLPLGTGPAFGGVASGLAANLFGASARGWKFDAGATRFGEADSDGLFGAARAVFALADVIHLFANKFSSLCGWRFAFAPIFFSAP